MEKDNLPCLGQEPSMYVGGEAHKPTGDFTFEAVLGENGYYVAFADNSVCETCKHVLNCADRLMRQLCESTGNDILETHIMQ